MVSAASDASEDSERVTVLAKGGITTVGYHNTVIFGLEIECC